MLPRLVAVDMDGTFLDSEGKIPPGFAQTYARLKEAGIHFTPASGRQLATLQDMFGHLGEELSFIAENGAVVAYQGQVTSTTTLGSEIPQAVVKAVAEFNATTARTRSAEGGRRAEKIWLIVCEANVGFLDDRHAAADPEVQKYYHSVEVVEDLAAVAAAGRVVKLAVFYPGDAEAVAAPLIARAAPHASVVVSGAHWVDVMNPEANKGRALAELAGYLDIPLADTVAFGDYLNDVELLRSAGTSYAMANAHPQLKEVATQIAPANSEYGVVKVLDQILASAPGTAS